MYQNPVGSLEKIRKLRRGVKHILSDIGLEDCQTFLETLRKSKTSENGDDSDEEDYFQQTEWADFSDVYTGKRKKKWPYRTRAFCCTLCHFNTRNWSAYRSHRQRYHEYEKALCNLAPCPSCPFIAPPKILKKHHMFFHSNRNPQDAGTGPLQPPTTTTVTTPTIYPRKEERYRCRKCQFQVSVLYKMKQHVLVRHLEYLMNHFCGKRPRSNSYSCKVCKETMPSFDRLIQHVLCTVAHQWVNTQVKTMIYENRNYLKDFNNQGYQLLAPKTQPDGSLAVGVGGIPAARVMQGTLAQKSSILKIPPVANPSFLPLQATALVQLASAEAKGLLRPGATVTLQNALHQQGIPSTMVRVPTGSTLPSSGTPLKQVPVPTIGAPGHQHQQQHQQLQHHQQQQHQQQQQQHHQQLQHHQQQQQQHHQQQQQQHHQQQQHQHQQQQQQQHHQQQQQQHQHQHQQQQHQHQQQQQHQHQQQQHHQQQQQQQQHHQQQQQHHQQQQQQQQQQHNHQQQQHHQQQQQQQQKALPQQFILPPGVQLNLGGPGAQPLLVAQRLPLNHTTPQGTMMTSQSLLSHLIPTGNKINGMPTYTLAPLHMAMPVQPGSAQAGSKAATPQPTNPQNTAQPLQPVKQTANSSLYTQAAKKWITCPICNELFPENVYKIHTEVNHKAPSRTSKQQGLAARAPFLRKMPDKTVKCLMCKCLLSEKGLFEHLLHGLNCLYCPGMFYSIKQLVEHTKEHNPAHKANCDFMRREYRLYTNEQGRLLFPYFDINTTAPKEVLGDTELNLALVTNSLDLIFLKMLPNGRQEVCRMPIKTTRTDCPFCDEKCQTAEKYQQHLKQKHFIAPTVHAILKTAAFKCIYCNGVYTGKTTQKAIMMHIQRCRCAPKTQKDAEKLMPPNTNREVIYPNFNQTNQVHQPPPVLRSAPPPKPPAPAPATSTAPEPPQSDVELQSKRRLELAWKEAMDANKKEREARAVQRKKREQEKIVPAVPPPEVQIDPTVQLALDPSGMELRPVEERKDFLTRYFHTNPYLTKRESEELSRRLLVSKSELALHVGQKRTKCMRAMQKKTAAVLMGFNMAEVNKLKHNLLIPEVEPAEAERIDETEDESDESERMDESKETAEPEESEKEDDSKETDEAEESEKIDEQELEEMSD